MSGLFYTSDLSFPIQRGPEGELISTFRRFELRTFSPVSASFSAFEEKLEEFRGLCTDPNINKRWRNYRAQELKFQDQHAISVFSDDGKIFGFSSVFSYAHFDSRATRILNRNFVLPEYRKLTTLDGEMNYSYPMAKHQMEFARGKFDFIFVSMEFPKFRLIEKWCEGAKEFSKMPWVVSPQLHLTCANRNSATCWQHIAYLEFDAAGRPFPLPGKPIEP